MIHTIHLIWIVPLAAFIGFMTCALFSINKNKEE